MSAEDETFRRQTTNDGSLTLEAPLRVSQILIEPVLKQTADENERVEVRFSWRLESFVQDAEGVTSVITNTKTGETETIRSRFLIGCDGGGSTVRTQLKIQTEGQPNVARLYMVHFRSKAVELLQRFGIAWHYQNGRGTLVAQDDRECWTLHAFVAPGTDESTISPRTLVEEWVGCKFDFEVIVANPWSAHYLVAEQYRIGNVLLAGDACHQYMPTGGYGMNSGIAEVGNLGWKIAATLEGWAGPELLNSYQVERRPIAKLSWATSEKHLAVRFKLANLFAEAGDLSGETPEANERRQKLGRQIADLGNAENEGWGTEHGYRYDGSGVICPEAGTPPAFKAEAYIPSTWPGSRLPHLFLNDGSPVFDHLGKWFTLIVLNSTDTSTIESTAREQAVPLKVLRINDENAKKIYERNLILVRPDQHVAWRGDDLPVECCELIARVSGNSD